jgi:hypothetical protein
MICRECGGKTDREYDACAGAIAEEIAQNVVLAVSGTQRLLSCNCCESCRLKCHESWMEENENINP